jgi:M-phase inducer tyrosine phosphatase
MTQWTSIHHSLPNQGLMSIHSLAFLVPLHRPSRTLTPSSMIQCPPSTVRLPAGPITKKHSSLSPVSPVSPAAPSVFHHGNSSSPMLPSLPQQKMERRERKPLLSRLNKPTLQGLGASSSALLKRPRRPALSAVVRPSDTEPTHSAYPVLAASGFQGEDNSPKGSPPVRRAFSALIPSSGVLESYSDESSFDGPDMSSPAQAYAKRQQIKTIRRCDGTDDFRPLTGATAMVMKESPSARFMAAGLPGFGDNEAHGKILPCHRVTEDGLMRISCHNVRVVVSAVVCKSNACWL